MKKKIKNLLKGRERDAGDRLEKEIIIMGHQLVRHTQVLCAMWHRLALVACLTKPRPSCPFFFSLFLQVMGCIKTRSNKLIFSPYDCSI